MNKISKFTYPFLFIVPFFVSNVANSASYVYDKLNRLTEVYYTSGQVIKYAYDDAGNLKTVTPKETLNPDTPKLSLSASVASGKWQVNENIHFQATPQNYPANSTIRYEWDFNNDGNIDRTTTSPEVDYSYPVAGAYIANLKTTVIETNYSLSATYALTIEPIVVTPQKGDLTFTLSQTSITEGNSITATIAFDRVVDYARSIRLDKSNNDISYKSSNITIPANQRLQRFTLEANDNAIVDGDRSITITASSSAANKAVSANLTILDNDSMENGLEMTSATLNRTNVVVANTIARNIEIKIKNNTSQTLYGITVDVIAPDVLTFTDGTSCGGSAFSLGASPKQCSISVDIDDFVAPGNYSLTLKGKDKTGNHTFTQNLDFTVENPDIPNFSMTRNTAATFSREPSQTVKLQFTGIRSGKGFWQTPTLMTLYMQRDGQNKTALHTETFDFRVSSQKVISHTFKAPVVPGEYKIWGEIFPSVDSDSSNNKSAVSLMTVNDPNATLPMINAISPLFALSGKATEFTVTGENLSDISFSLIDCSNPVAIAGGTATAITFSCTPNSSTGVKQGLIKDATGKIVKSFVIEIQKPIATSPVISPNGGRFADQVEVTLSADANLTNAKIYYTIDGSVPSASSLLYSAPLVLKASTTIKAITLVEGYKNSPVTTNDFAVIPSPTVEISVDVPETSIPSSFVATVFATGTNLPTNLLIEIDGCSVSRGTQYDETTKQWSNTCITLIAGTHQGRVKNADTGEVIKTFELELKYAEPTVTSVTTDPAEITLGQDVVFTIKGKHLALQTSVSIEGFETCNLLGGASKEEKKFRCKAVMAGKQNGVVILSRDLSHPFSIDVQDKLESVLTLSVAKKALSLGIALDDYMLEFTMSDTNQQDLTVTVSSSDESIIVIDQQWENKILKPSEYKNALTLAIKALGTGSITIQISDDANQTKTETVVISTLQIADFADQISEEQMNLSAARGFCQNKSGRLPTIEELRNAYQLIDNPITILTKAMSIWSSSEAPDNKGNYYSIYLNEPWAWSNGSADSENYVHCINVSSAFTWDIDGDGKVQSLTDSLLVLRYLFDFRGDALIKGAVDTNASRNTAEAIEAYLQQSIDSNAMDIDGDGTVKPLTDGLLLLRYLSNFRDDSLMNGAMGIDASRNTDEQIDAYIRAYLP